MNVEVQAAKGKVSYFDLALFAGFGFYWAWLFLVFYSPVVAPHSESISMHVQDIWAWAAWAHAVALLLIGILATKIKTLIKRRGSIIAWSIITCIGTAFLPLGDTLASWAPNIAVAVDISGALITGISTAVIVLMWAELFAKIGFRNALLGMISAYLLGSILYFVVILFPPAVSALFTILSPMLCGICLLLVKRREVSKLGTLLALPRKASFSVRVLIPLSAIFLYALCGEILRAFATISGDSASFGAMGELYIFGGVVGLLVLLLIIFVSSRIAKVQSNEIATIRAALLIMAAGFLVSALFGVSFFLAYAIFGAAFQCFRAIVWAYLANISERLDVSPLRVFGLTQACFAFAVVVGAPLAQGLTSVVTLGIAQWTSIALAVIFLIFVSAVFIMNQRDIQSIWGLSSVPEKKVETDAVEASAVSSTAETKLSDIGFLQEEHGLSARELEVAQLLAKGRSLPFIQEELHIAKGTAQTHLNHIYKKLDVHSRQEFLDLVERGPRTKYEK